MLVIDNDKFNNPSNLSYTYFNVFQQNLFSIISEKIRQKNDRIRILEKKTIRDRLLEYFEVEYKKNHSKHIYLSSSYKDLADFLALNRAAMFRELRNLKDERFIESKGRRITLLYK